MAVSLDRLSSFRVIYIAIFGVLVLYLFSLEAAEVLLNRHFRSAVTEALRVSPTGGPVAQQIQERVGHLVHDSPWVRYGGVRINVQVLAFDGRTPLYLVGRTVPPPPNADQISVIREASRLLPASADVIVTVPPDSLLSTGMLVAYLAVLFPVLFFHNRALARREAAVLAEAMSARDASAERAGGIERELQQVRRRLAETEPSERAHVQEIRELESEREALQRQLESLAHREAELRARAARTTELEGERQALEDLLEEAVEDLSQKEREIVSLQDRLKHAAKAPPRGRARDAEQLARRTRTLYKNLEIEDRAIQDMLALRDETMKLKAEEALKRLSDDSDTAAVRRKVGGLPPHLSIFELGFAGKGRIYYARSKQRRYRVLAIGAKNSQKTDLEYLSRLDLD